jgi:hypothetical protein
MNEWSQSGMHDMSHESCMKAHKAQETDANRRFAAIGFLRAYPYEQFLRMDSTFSARGTATGGCRMDLHMVESPPVREPPVSSHAPTS